MHLKHDAFFVRYNEHSYDSYSIDALFRDSDLRGACLDSDGLHARPHMAQSGRSEYRACNRAAGEHCKRRVHALLILVESAWLSSRQAGSSWLGKQRVGIDPC